MWNLHFWAFGRWGGEVVAIVRKVVVRSLVHDGFLLRGGTEKCALPNDPSLYLSWIELIPSPGNVERTIPT